MKNLRTAYRPKPRQRLIAQEGMPFVIAALCATGIAFVLHATPLFLIFLLVTLFILFFFRNPERAVPEGKGVLVSPADGRVVSIDACDSTPLIGGPSQKLSIFLSVFNVHINRVPIASRVKQLVYNAGRYHVASRHQASEQNEQNLILLEDREGRPYVLAQVAGFVARRIICYLREGEDILSGERLGLIRFGSRVDLYLPLDAILEVKVGDHVRGGSTILGRYRQ